MKTNQIIARLGEGNCRFVADKLDGRLQNSSRRSSLTSKQEPFAIVLGCADSRVVPELAFDSGLGELFVIRVAGNVANTSTIASIEYAVKHLGTKVIVVLGHQGCGAVTAAVGGGDHGHNLNHLLAHVTPAVIAAKDGAGINEVVRLNAQLTVKELIGRSSIIAKATGDGTGDFQVVPAYYNLDSGRVDFLPGVNGIKGMEVDTYECPPQA